MKKNTENFRIKYVVKYINEIEIYLKMYKKTCDNNF